MFTYESNGREHYTYFPIEYPTRDPVALVSFKGPTNEPVWIKVIDKAKFIDGYGTTYHLNNSKCIYLISIGF